MNSIHWVNFALTVVLVAAIVYQMRNIHHSDPSEYQFLKSPLTSLSDETESSSYLDHLTKVEFAKPEVLKITNRVYVATSIAIANSVLIVGDDGLIIVDTTENSDAMSRVLAEFRKISTKPVKAIIFTHFHQDHTTGFEKILAEGKKLYPGQKIEIYAHEKTRSLLMGEDTLRDIGFVRTVRQFGMILPESLQKASGVGRAMDLSKTKLQWEVPEPTVTYKDRGVFTVAGVNFEMIHTPGETDDQSTIWLPDDGVVLAGDNIYKSFPHLYAIRGQLSRDCIQWYKSLDKVRSLKAKYLIPGHTKPIIGAEAVEGALTAYRDAIKYTHDQTVRYMNKGYVPDDIVRVVRLPDYLASHTMLRETYGTLEWSIRGVFADYVGWFNGDAADLEPLHSSEISSRLLKFVGEASGHPNKGADVILREAQESLETSHRNYKNTGKHIVEDEKWALLLAKLVLANNGIDATLRSTARNIQISVLRALALEHSSSNGRNYYLVSSLEAERGQALQRPAQARGFILKSSPAAAGFEIMCLKMKGLECQYRNVTVVFEFSDSHKKYWMNLRNGICDYFTGQIDNPNIIISTDEEKWAFFRAGEITVDELRLSQETKANFLSFLECFDAII